MTDKANLVITEKDILTLELLILETVLRPRLGNGPLSMQVAAGFRDVLEYYKNNPGSFDNCVNAVDGVDTMDIYFWPAHKPIIYYVGEPFSKKVRGSLSTGSGRVLVHMLKNLKVPMTKSYLVEISHSWSLGSVHSCIYSLNRQLRLSQHYRIKRRDDNYLMLKK